MNNEFINNLTINVRNCEVLSFTNETFNINNDVFAFKGNIPNKKIYFKFNLDNYFSNLILKDFTVSMLSDKQNNRMTINNIYKKYNEFKKLLSYLDSLAIPFNELDVAILNSYVLNNIKSLKNFILSLKTVVGYFLNNNSFSSFLVPISKYLDNFKFDGDFKKTSIGVMDDEFVSAFLSLLVSLFEKTDETSKLIISLILLQSQIGLRTNEILYLDAQMPVETEVDGCYIIQYRSYKNSRRKEVFFGETVLNKFAYKYFMFAYNLNQNKYKHQELYGSLGSNRYLKINSFIQRICVKYHKFLGTLNNDERNYGLFCENGNKLCTELKLHEKFNEEDVIYYPTIQRFRNYRFNFLFKHNVPKEVIDKTVTHELDTKIDEIHYIDSFKNYEESAFKVYYGKKSKNFYDSILKSAEQFKNIKKFDECFFEYGESPVISKKYGYCLLSNEDEACDCLYDDLICDETTLEYNIKRGFLKIANFMKVK